MNDAYSYTQNKNICSNVASVSDQQKSSLYYDCFLAVANVDKKCNSGYWYQTDEIFSVIGQYKKCYLINFFNNQACSMIFDRK